MDDIPAALYAFAQTTDFTNLQVSFGIVTFIVRRRLGLAYLSAHLAYSQASQESDLVTEAVSLWTTASSSFVTAADASAGSVAGTGNFNSTCPPLTGGSSRVSVAGALTWAGPPSVNGETIGSWIILSSRLYHLEGDQTYLDRAATSIAFVKAFLSNGTMIFDGYDYGTCALTQTSHTDSSGFFLQGLSAYYAYRSEPPTTEELDYVNELAASLILTPHWTDTNGINKENAITNSTQNISYKNPGGARKSILVEGLYQCFLTGLLNDTVKNLTEQYISVQYNAVRELANYTVPTINQPIYGPSWEKPALNLTDFNLPGQIAASQLFVTALGVGPSPASSDSSMRSRVRTGAVAGGVVGALTVVVVAILVGLYCRRRKRRARGYVSENDESRADPFYATNEQYPLSERDRSLSKHRHTPGLRPTPASGEGSVSSARALIGQDQGGDEGMVPVDASALQRLLLSVGGALSDLQRRRSRNGGDGSSITEGPPPDYEEGASRGH
ncbi:unnamed protein product [Peniophora sp. CBMAI 1063]|nr:unnamed protein product [Peniophora sp. CBMAI 1063]